MYNRNDSPGRRYSRIGYCVICGAVTHCKSDAYNDPPKTCGKPECRHEIYSRSRLAQTWRQPAKMHTFTCKHCGAEKTIKRTQLNKPGSGQFCCRKCKSDYWLAHPEESPRWEGGRVDAVCIQCGKTFKVFPYVLRDGHGKFCSGECQSKWKSLNTRGENSPSWKGGEIDVPCCICGTIVKRFQYQVAQTSNHICSQKCRSEWVKKMFPAGETHPRYKHGFVHKGYHKTYNDEFRDIIRNYHNGYCFMCGKHQDDFKTKHDVHHVNPSEYRLPVNQTVSGFIPLCKSCHGKLQGQGEFAYWTEYFTMLFDLCDGWGNIFTYITGDVLCEQSK